MRYRAGVLRCASVAHPGLHICLTLRSVRWRAGVLRSASNLPSCLKIRFRDNSGGSSGSSSAMRMTLFFLIPIIFPVASFSLFFLRGSVRYHTSSYRKLPSHRSVGSVRKRMQVFRQRECRLGARSNNLLSNPRYVCDSHVESLRYREPWYQAVLRVS